VNIITKIKTFSGGKNGITTRYKAGFLVRYDEDDPEYGWVVYHGKPSHFTPPGQSYGTYIEKFSLNSLAERDPVRGDPLEF